MIRYSACSSTVEEFIKELQNHIAHGLDPKSVIRAYDPDEMDVVDITGFIMDPVKRELIIQTDDNS